VNSAIENRHLQIRKFWGEMLERIGVPLVPLDLS
jgi:hypothetical protein